MLLMRGCTGIVQPAGGPGHTGIPQPRSAKLRTKAFGQGGLKAQPAAMAFSRGIALDSAQALDAVEELTGCGRRFRSWCRALSSTTC